MIERPPAHEVLEAAAWFGPPFLVLLAALWALAARRFAKRAAQFAAEDVRLDEQARRERAARKGRAA